MAGDDEQARREAGGRVNYVCGCPQCGKTAPLGRRYCVCRAPLNHAGAREAEKPELERLNFETAELSCADCPEECVWRMSFGSPLINGRGFGGKECKYRTSAPPGAGAVTRR
jgi:hypothetical protein